MISAHGFSQQQPHVVVRFGDGAHSFPLAEGGTLAELAGRIDALGALHEGAPIAIHIRFAAPDLNAVTATSTAIN